MSNSVLIISHKIPFEKNNYHKNIHQKFVSIYNNWSNQVNPFSNNTLYSFYLGGKGLNGDLENILFYNIGSGAFSKLAKYRILCEHAGTIRTIRNINPNEYQGFSLYYYENAIQNKQTNFWEKGSLLISFTNCVFGKLYSNAFGYWYDVKNFLIDEQNKNKISNIKNWNKESPLYIEIKINLKQNRMINLANTIKPVVDGIMTALQYMTNPSQQVINDVLTKLSNLGIQSTNQQLNNLITNTTNAVMGNNTCLFIYRKGIQTNPQDQTLVVIDISVNYNQQNNEIDVKLYEANLKNSNNQTISNDTNVYTPLVENNSLGKKNIVIGSESQIDNWTENNIWPEWDVDIKDKEIIIKRIK